MSARAWLGMYDHPRQHAANDALWAAIARELRAAGLGGVPYRLARELPPHAAWGDPELLLGQICIRPLREHFPALQVLGHPVYADSGSPARHRSLVVVGATSPIRFLAQGRGTRVAINDRGSNTGYRLLEELTGPLERWAGRIVATGSHRDSMRAVARGEADLAAIDDVTFAAIARYDLALAKGVRVIERTRTVPTPPFVTAAATPIHAVAALRRALARVIGGAAQNGAVAPLGLIGFVPTGPLGERPDRGDPAPPRLLESAS